MATIRARRGEAPRRLSMSGPRVERLYTGEAALERARRGLEKEGVLRLTHPSGRWAVCRPGLLPVEITSGDVFRVEVDGELKVTRMEFAHSAGGGQYYSV